MENIEAKKFTDRIFGLIRNANTIEELISIEENEFEDKYRMDKASYPKIEFAIKPSDINELVDRGYLNSDFSFSENVTEKITDPLTKLLYSLSWKNGDLKKLKHIAKGVSEVEIENPNQDVALVFYQFGKHLTKKEGQPIIDQHVIRAFSISNTNDANTIERYRKLGVIGKNEKEIINNYIVWLGSGKLSDNLKSMKDYSYFIDKILYSTGKKIKMKTKK